MAKSPESDKNALRTTRNAQFNIEKMQDPERAHPGSKDQQHPPAPIDTPPKRQLAITRDEAEATKYPDHRDVIDEILTTTRK